MCGIVGFLNPQGLNPVVASSSLEKMVNALNHQRDDSGQWIDSNAGIALGHSRLSVIDITAAGHQPMHSEDGRFILIFNGEVYNHLELREKLRHRCWRGHSDTETLLAGIQEWGLESTLKMASGMFAIALWDKNSQTLLLARDRLGEKPLYYGWQDQYFLFGSEIKALAKHPSFVGEIDRFSLSLFVKRGYIPTPHSIFSGIKKLTPGAILEIKPTNYVRGDLQPQSYWSLSQVVANNNERRFTGQPKEAVDLLEARLLKAIDQQRISDVPLGAFLSGGTDSSMVVALMQSISSRPVKTFTIGFKEDGYNEANHAREVANFLKTDHTEMYISAEDAIRVIPQLPSIYDEPFADVSQIPTVLVSRLAHQQVTVALSGDGGDELFCGYDRYSQVVNIWERLSLIPYPMRLPLRYIFPTKKVAQGVACKTVDALYQYLHYTQWKEYPRLVLRAGNTHTLQCVPTLLSEAKERMMYVDALNYLPDDILVKVDRAAMSSSLETRVPLLDHGVVELAWQLPLSIKNKNGIHKWPLKQILYKYIPEHILNRPKMGFGVPIGNWLRSSLRDWAESLLAKDTLTRDGFFDPMPIRAEWNAHLSGKRDRGVGLWTILMFQAWYHNV